MIVSRDPSTVFICCGGHHFTEMEVEMGMTTATMNYLMTEPAYSLLDEVVMRMDPSKRVQ